MYRPLSKRIRKVIKKKPKSAKRSPEEIRQFILKHNPEIEDDLLTIESSDDMPDVLCLHCVEKITGVSFKELMDLVRSGDLAADKGHGDAFVWIEDLIEFISPIDDVALPS